MNDGAWKMLSRKHKLSRELRCMTQNSVGVQVFVTLDGIFNKDLFPRRRERWRRGAAEQILLPFWEGAGLSKKENYK